MDTQTRYSLILGFLMLSLFIVGCNKNDLLENDFTHEKSTLKVIKLEKVNFAKESAGFRDDGGKDYIEFACVVNDDSNEEAKAGTLCKKGLNGTCKKAHPCEAIPNPQNPQVSRWNT